MNKWRPGAVGGGGGGVKQNRSDGSFHETQNGCNCLCRPLFKMVALDLKVFTLWSDAESMGI